jgi:catechol 2,3-dioxygenase-like lactoylglutathione lyase family enzyme
MKALSHIRFLVPDVAADVAFYRDTIGLKQVVDVPGVYAEFDTGASRLAFYRAELMSDVLGTRLGSRGDDVVLCLRVDNVDAEVKRLESRGVAMLRAPHDEQAWYQRVAHFAIRQAGWASCGRRCRRTDQPRVRWPSTRCTASRNPVTATRQR